MDNSFIAEGFDVRLLSDEDLHSHLMDYGFAPGPIMDNTRGVYQRKLASLMRHESTMHNDDDDETALQTGDGFHQVPYGNQKFADLKQRTSTTLSMADEKFSTNSDLLHVTRKRSSSEANINLTLDLIKKKKT